MPNKKELLRDEMPTLSIQKGKHPISHLNIIFLHSSSMTYDMEIIFKIEPSDENVCTSNSISGEFSLKLHTNFQDLIDLVEPLIRKDIGLADTTGVEINFIRIYPKQIKKNSFRMAMSYRAICSTTGCASQEHSNEIKYAPEVFARVNKILKDTGFKLNIDIESITSLVDSTRFEIMDL